MEIQWPSPVTNLNLSQPALRETLPCQGNLTGINHSLPTQL